jgi:hypothetical protein
MKRHSRLASIVFISVLTSACAQRATAAEAAAVMVYAGDGLTVRVLEWSETAGTLRGEIVLDGDTFPFTGRHRETDDAEIVTGTFKAGGESFKFTTRQDEGSDAVVFTTGGATYRLLPVAAADEPGGPAANPLDKRPGKPAPAKPAARAKPAKPAKPAGAPARSGGAKGPPVLRLKQHAFPDATMGAPAAYTVLLPAEWSASGQIEWQPVGEVPFPQLKVEITSPKKGRIRFLPQVTFAYSEGPLVGRQGVPAPADFPQWVAEAVARANPKLDNVDLVRSSRDAKAEKFLDDADRAANGAGGMEREIHVVVLDYDDEEGVRRREEANLTYVRFPPFHGINGFSTQTWSVFNGGAVSAPADDFDAQRPELLNVAGTLRPTPEWHVHSQAVIAENSRRRAQDTWRAIRERGRQISKLSDDQYAKYKKDMSAGDAAQRTRVNGIYETDDFTDTDGNVVNLPMHYRHVFSDGKGNYVLSNNSQDKPGELWTPIEPIK